MKNIWSKSQIRFLIFSAGRTGSNLLISMLNAHPEVYCSQNRMIFNNPLASYFPMMRLAIAVGILQETAYGHSIGLHQFAGTQQRVPTLLEKLHKRNWRFIHLRRGNVVRQAVSAMTARDREIFHHVGQNAPEKPRVSIQPERLLKKIQKKEKLTQAELTYLKPFPLLSLVYEDDLLPPDVHQATTNKVFAYLGLSPTIVDTPYVKIGKNNLEKQILNYEEVSQSLVNTPYYQYLELP